MDSSISMAGMGTGLDVYGMATTMATAETSAKSNQLTDKETEINEEIASLEAIDSALNGFYNTLNKYSDPSVFGSVTVNMSGDDKEFASVKVDDTAVPNTYEMEIDQLATQHKIQWASDDAETGSITPGDYTLSVGGEPMTFTVEAGANSYADVADQINDDPNNPGITASVLTDGDQAYLTLTANETGADNTLEIYEGSTLVVPEEELKAAQNAMYKIDGVALTSPDNSIDDVIEGVTIDLHDVTTGPDDGPISFKVEPDVEVMEASINAIIDSFNGVMTTIDNLTETSFDEQGNPMRQALTGDAMLNSVERELRDVLYTSFDDTFSNMASIGIITDTNGKLEVDDEKLQDALEEDADAVADMFVETDGIIDGFQDVTAKYVGRAEEMTDPEGNIIDPEEDNNSDYISSTGLIDDRLDGLREEQDDVEEEWLELESRYESIYERYLNEYIAMDLAVAQMNSSYSYL